VSPLTYGITGPIELLNYTSSTKEVFIWWHREKAILEYGNTIEIMPVHNRLFSIFQPIYQFCCPYAVSIQ
jgi:hypothetical protein